MLLLLIFGTGALILAIRLGWYASRCLDYYDWHYAKREIIQSLITAPIFWPLMLLVPRHLLQVLRDPACLFEKAETLTDVGFANAKFWREWTDLEVNSPPCGRYVRYRPLQCSIGDVCGVFTMSAKEAEAAIWQELDERYAPLGVENDCIDIPAVGSEERAQHIRRRDLHKIEGVEGSVLRWLARRDDSLLDPTDIPSLWHGIDYIAEKLALLKTKWVKMLLFADKPTI